MKNKIIFAAILLLSLSACNATSERFSDVSESQKESISESEETTSEESYESIESEEESEPSVSESSSYGESEEVESESTESEEHESVTSEAEESEEESEPSVSESSGSCGESEEVESESTESEEHESVTSEAEESEDVSESESHEDTSEYVDPALHLDGDPITYDKVAQDYYKDISDDLEGEDLRGALYRLVSKKWKSVGYGGLWAVYPYSDADPDNPTSGMITAYYRGTPATRNEMNREHVWPDSRGGSFIEGDPHMTRPTLTSDNSSRGNSFYVEGMCSTKDGWDPKMDGLTEFYRGDCARIIMYCAVAKYGTLDLVDKTNDDASNHTMGKLSDLIKWNYEYPVSKYEILRNEVLSGERTINGKTFDHNRNPFIDDRNLACRIWGDTNKTTKQLCAMYMRQTAPTSLTLNESEIKLEMGEEFKLEVVDASPAGASRSVTWSIDDESVATIDSDGMVHALEDGVAYVTATSKIDEKIKTTCKVVVETEEKPLESISVDPSMELTLNSSKKLEVTFNPSNVNPRPTLEFVSSNSNVVSVDKTGLLTGLAVGKSEISVCATQGEVKKYATCNVNVSELSAFSKVTSTQSNWAGKYLIVCESANMAFNSAAASIDSNTNDVAVTIKNNLIESSSALLDAAVTIEQVGGEYRLKTSTGKYITSSDKSVVLSEDESARVTIQLENGSSVIKCGSTKQLMYNSTWGGFRFYAGNMAAVSLYKL